MSEPKNDAAPADVQKPTDEDLAGAVIKASEAFNQALADAMTAGTKLEAAISTAISAAKTAGIQVRFDGRHANTWPDYYSGPTFSRTVAITAKR